MPTRPPLLLVALLLAGGCTTAPRSAGVAPAGASSAAQLGDEYLRRYFQREPEWAMLTAYPGADLGAVHDASLAAVRAWEAEEDRFLDRARRLDLAAPSEADRATRAVLVDQLEGSVATRRCRPELWNVSSIGGWQSRFAGLAAVQPVGTPELRAAALSRLRALPRLVAQETDDLREGLRLGYTASRDNVERALTELDALVATLPSASPFLDPALRDGDPAFRAEMERTVADELAPATRRYRDFLRGEYLARARAAPGVSALPDGEACYRAAVRRFTSLELPARRIHELGLERVAELADRMKRLAERSFATADLPALLERLRTDPRYTFESREQVLSMAQGAIARATAALPRWFGRVPAAGVAVRPYPDFQERSSPADSYRRLLADGRIEGMYFVNAFEPRRTSRAGAESTAFHETVPGHHLQMALALESPDAPAVGRYLWSSGFGEGWALYAEQLADEMGLYSSDLERLGMLSNQSFRAVRLVVDSGIHALGWPRERAVRYLLEHTELSPAVAASEVDRYAAWPGQASAYMLGEIEIERLRREAQAALGARFDVRAFHDAVLEAGTVPLPYLDEMIRAWVARRAARAAAPAGSR